MHLNAVSSAKVRFGFLPVRLVSSQAMWSASLRGSFRHSTETTPVDCFTLRPRRHHPFTSSSPWRVHTLSAWEMLSRSSQISSGSVRLVSFSLTQPAEYETRLKESCRQHVKIPHKPVPTGPCRSEFTSFQRRPGSVQQHRVAVFNNSLLCSSQIGHFVTVNRRGEKTLKIIVQPSGLTLIQLIG